MFPFWHKLVISREPLEHRPFANGYGAILLRMSEPAIPENPLLSCNNFHVHFYTDLSVQLRSYFVCS